MLRNTLPVGSITKIKTSTPVLSLDGEVVPLSAGPWRRGPCFSCGQQGHGVNRCSRMDVSFPFLLPGLVGRCADGQYRASRIRGDGRNSAPGKGGMVRAGGSASRTIDDRDAPDPGGGGASPGGGGATGLGTAGGMYPHISMDPNAQGFPALGSLSPAEGDDVNVRFRITAGMCWKKDTPKVPDLAFGDG